MKVGILGGGQLGRMLALAGQPMGIDFRFLAPQAGSPSGEIAEQVVAEYDNLDALSHFADGLDVATFEFESVPLSAVEKVSEMVAVYPSPNALRNTQDRILEKQCFERLEIPGPRFIAVGSIAELRTGVKEIGTPCVLKTRTQGYDGKGQFVLRNATEIETAWVRLGGVPLILEEYIAFSRELSVISVRGRDGQSLTYPLVENHHTDGILRMSVAPAPRVSAELQSLAEDYAERVSADLGYVGVLTIEFFQRGEDLLANEMAPRVHNSGHWTIEGASTSQFENHLRAILGMALGRTDVEGAAAMLNFIGKVPPLARIERHADAYVHLYGKDPAPKRKLGHVTVVGPDMQSVSRSIAELRALL